MEKQTQAPNSGRSGKFLAIALLLVGLGVGGGSGALAASALQGRTPSAEPPVAAEADTFDDDGWEDELTPPGGRPAAPGPIYLVEDLVLNPAGTQGTRFLMATVAIEVRDQAAADQVRERDPLIRDRLLSVLGSKTIVELVEPDSAREALRRELRDSTARLLPRGSVRQVYLPRFVVQ